MAKWTRVGPGVAPGSQTYTDGVYKVTIHSHDDPAEGWPKMLHLSMSRVDRGAMTDWREKQRIKNELVGPEHEGVELYPAESRKVDGANQFHLYVFTEKGVTFPFGFFERMVGDGSTLPGVTQRPGSGASPEDEAAARELEARYLAGEIKL